MDLSNYSAVSQTRFMTYLRTSCIKEWLNPVRHILSSSLIFRGSKDENAVLCTHNQTYDVKEAETSNSLLLLPDLRWPAQIADQTGRMLEEKQVIDFHYRQSNKTGKWLFIIYLFIWDHQSVKDCVFMITVMKVLCSFVSMK